MKIFLSIWLLVFGVIYLNFHLIINELDVKLDMAIRTEIADKKLIKSLQNSVKLHEQDMIRYHAKRGTTVDEAVCDEVRAFLKGEYSLFPF